MVITFIYIFYSQFSFIIPPLSDAWQVYVFYGIYKKRNSKT